MFGHPYEPEDFDALEERLEHLLTAATSSRRTATGPAEKLFVRSPEEQDLVLHWVEVSARTNPEMAYQLADRAASALAIMTRSMFRDWIVSALDAYDRRGLAAGVSVLKHPEAFQLDHPRESHGATLVELARFLEKFVYGLGGRPLGIEVGEIPHTDTETLFLPARIVLEPTLEANRLVYRRLAAHLWGLTRFGSFFPELGAHLERWPDRDRAGMIYGVLENRRVHALLRPRLPGLFREVVGIRPPSESWNQALMAVTEARHSREVSLQWLDRLYPLADPLPELPFCHGQFVVQTALKVLERRLEKEIRLFRTLLGQVQQHEGQKVEWLVGPDAGGERMTPEDGMHFSLRLDGVLVEPPEALVRLACSIVQDLGQLPPECSHPAGPGPGGMALEETSTAAAVWSGTYHEDGAFLYDEWDHLRQDYRKGWCALRELPAAAGDESFVAETMEKYRGLVQRTRRAFELLRGGDRRLRRQSLGDEIDVDALVEALADRRRGNELSDRLFRRLAREDRDVAALILVDLSGSTKGWVNTAIRESLVLLCDGLEHVGDRYGVFGFSGMTRKRCEFYRIKPMDEPWNEAVRRRIGALEPMEYTRMGVFIRHASARMKEVAARTRLLITLSDGRPEDYDGYRGKTGLEDTRKALIEARRDGLHPFCITVDSEARDYLPHLYGPARFVVLDSPRSLPEKIAEVYRRLTH
ncbi:MAG: nitric oxide reductase activation protein [Magnetococcales bacterium]|nr:nitric oxide reductase activation protein [Magnetococcales bacterium]